MRAFSILLGISCELIFTETFESFFLNRIVRVKAAKIIEKNQDTIPDSVKKAIQQARTIEEVNDLVRSHIILYGEVN